MIFLVSQTQVLHCVFYLYLTTLNHKVHCSSLQSSPFKAVLIGGVAPHRDHYTTKEVQLSNVRPKRREASLPDLTWGKKGKKERLASLPSVCCQISSCKPKVA